MTSVSIISGVASRMKSLMREQTDSRRLLLSEMESTTKMLKAADLETRTSKPFLGLEKMLVRLSYEIEETVEQWILSKLKPRPSNIIFRVVTGSNDGPPNLLGLITNLIHLKTLLEYVMVENVPHPGGAAGRGSWVRHGDENVGAAAVEMQVTESLMGPDSASSVVCIYGASGTGKTSLAKKVFDDARCGDSTFRGFAWVRVNRDCELRKVFEEILQQLSPAKKKVDMCGMDAIEMSQQIIAIQMEKKCLIVLEDIWAVDDWNHIRYALLLSGFSRTLITTTSIQVAQIVKNSKGQICKMQPLDGPETVTLLKNKARFNDHELELHGEIISSISQGWPLFVVVLGKSFKAAPDEWVDDLGIYRNRISQGENDVLDICYDILPDELKACWLYLGQFPEGQDIEVDKLHLLLDAEGITPPREPITYILRGLAERTLVKLQEDTASMTTMYKSCQLHELVRNFCISKGLEKELFEIIRVESGKKAITISPSTHRLAVNLSNYKGRHAVTFANHQPAKKIRSILIFDACGGSESNTTRSSRVKGLQQFSSLRVLDLDGVDFRVRKEVLTGMDKFVLLRYLGFRRCWLEKLPSSVGKLLILETLDLRVQSSCKMFIPNNILSNMKSLKNLYFPMLYETQERTKLLLRGLERLEILVHFHTSVCNVNDLSHLSNLQILTTISEENHGDLATIVEKATSNMRQSSFVIRNFDCYSADRAMVLKRLLECRSLHSLHIHGHINPPPKGVAISPNLSEIVFDGSEIEDDPKVVLQRFNNLRSIVLSNNVFVGDKTSIVFTREYFPNLRSLKLMNVRNIEILEFQEGSVPGLSTLVVENCADLHKVLMPRALDDRLQAVRRKKGDDVYTVELTPTII